MRSTIAFLAQVAMIQFSYCTAGDLESYQSLIMISDLAISTTARRLFQRILR